MKIIKTIAIFCFFEYIICNRVARSLLALGTKLRLVLSFFTLRSDFMDFQLQNVQMHLMTSIMMKTIFTIKKVTGK